MTVSVALSRACQFYAIDHQGELKRERRYQVLYGVRRTLGAFGIGPTRCEINAMRACFERTKQQIGVLNLSFSEHTRRLYRKISDPEELAVRLREQMGATDFEAPDALIQYIAMNLEQWSNLYPALRNILNARKIAKINGNLLAYLLPSERDIRRDRIVIELALRFNISNWGYIDHDDKIDRDFLAFALKINGCLLGKLPELQSSVKLIVIALAQTPRAWQYIPLDLREEPVRLYDQILQHAMMDDRVVKNLPYDRLISLLFIEMVVRSENSTVICKAIFHQYPLVWQYYESKICSDIVKLSRECLAVTPSIYRYFSPRYQADPVNLIRHLSGPFSSWSNILEVSSLLQWLSSEQLAQIFNEIIIKDPSCIHHMNEDQLNFYYSMNENAWSWIPQTLKTRSTALHVLKLNGKALSVIKKENFELFNKHRTEFYLAALTRYPQIWLELEADYTDDLLFQVEAIEIHGGIVEWIPDASCSPSDAIRAISSKKNCWHLIDQRLKRDSQFINAALKANPAIAAQLTVDEAFALCHAFPVSYSMMPKRIQVDASMYSLITRIDPTQFLSLELSSLFEMVKKDPTILEAIPLESRDHRQYLLVNAAINPHMIQEVDDLTNEEILSLLAINPKIFRFVLKQTHRFSEIRLAAIKADPVNFMMLDSRYINDYQLWKIMLEKSSHCFALISERMAHLPTSDRMWYLPIFEQYPTALIHWIVGFSIYFEPANYNFHYLALEDSPPQDSRWVMLHRKNPESGLPRDSRIKNSILSMILTNPDLLPRVPLKFFHHRSFLEQLITLCPQVASYYVKNAPSLIKPFLVHHPQIRGYYFNGLNSDEVIAYLRFYPDDFVYLSPSMKANLKIASHIISVDPAYYYSLPDLAKSDARIFLKVVASGKVGFSLVVHHLKKKGCLRDYLDQIFHVQPESVVDFIKGWRLFRIIDTDHYVVQDEINRSVDSILFHYQMPLDPTLESPEIMEICIRRTGLVLKSDSRVFAEIPDSFRFNREYLQIWLDIHPKLIQTIYEINLELALDLASSSKKLQAFLFGQSLGRDRLYLPIPLKDPFRLNLIEVPSCDRLVEISEAIDRLVLRISLKCRDMTADQITAASSDKSRFIQLELASEFMELKHVIETSFMARLISKIEVMIRTWETSWEEFDEDHRHRLITMLYKELRYPTHMPSLAESSDLDRIFKDSIRAIRGHLLAQFRSRLFEPLPGVGTPDPLKNPEEYGMFWKQIYRHLAYANTALEKNPFIAVQLLYSQRYCSSNLQSQIHQISMEYATESSLDIGLAKLIEAYSMLAQEAMEKVLLVCFPNTETIRDPHHVNAVWYRYQRFCNKPLVIGDSYQRYFDRVFHESHADRHFYSSFCIDQFSRVVRRLYVSHEAVRRFMDSYYSHFIAEPWTEEDLETCRTEVEEMISERWSQAKSRMIEIVHLSWIKAPTVQQRLRYMALGGKSSFDSFPEEIRLVKDHGALLKEIERLRPSWIRDHRPTLFQELIDIKKAQKQVFPVNDSGEISKETIYLFLEHIGFLHSEQLT